MDDKAGLVTAIVLAAGLSTRMGQTKALLPWHGQPLVAYQVKQLRAAGVQDVVVVTGHDAERVAAEAAAAGGRQVFNAEYQAGRAGSLRAGAMAVPECAGAVVILNVDQPRPATLIRALLTAHARWAGLITIPAFHGKRGHPPVLSAALLPELQSVSEEQQGLREVIRRHRDAVQLIETNDRRCLLDLNTPEAYRLALPVSGESDSPAPVQ